MARGKVQKPGKRASRTKPQNLRPDSGKFDPRQSSIKRLADWDQEEAQDEQDDFFEGLDKVSLQQTGRDTRFENDLEIPEQLLDIDDGEEETEEDDDDEEDGSESEGQKSKPRKQRKPKASVDNSHKGRFGKVASASETHSDQTDSEDGSEEDVDPMQLDQNELETEGGKLADDDDGSSDEDESTWKSYHVAKSKSKKKKSTNDPEAVAEEEERRALELEEVKRLQAKARSKLIPSDFSSYLDYASDEEILATEATKKLNQDQRFSSSHSTLVKEFDSEPEAVAYLLKTKPECLALLNDFRRSLDALSDLQDKISTTSDPTDGDQEKNEFNRAIDLLHYHVLSTYVSTTAFYMHLSLHIPPPAPALVGSVTKSLIDLRNTLNLMEQAGLIGDSSESGKLLLGGSGMFDGQFPASEFDEELRELLFDQSNPDDDQSDSGSDDVEPTTKRRKSSDEVSASRSDKIKEATRSKSKQPKKKKQKDSKKSSQIEVEDPNELLKNLPPRPSKSILNSSEYEDRNELDFLESTSLSEKEAKEKEKKKKSLRFYTAKIDAKGKRREKALAGTGIVSGDSDLPYITKESQRRELLKKQDHSVTGVDQDGQFEDSLDGYLPDASFDQDGEADYYNTIKELKLSSKKAKKVQYDEKRLAERDALMTEGDVEGGDNGPREISRQILKNKGLTPKRAKENRNPRVKKRKRFEKAQQKISSQRPTFKPDLAAQSRTLNGYQGEKSGVKVGVVKSRKL
ncbi:hypothetical protein PGTUg99_005375 [Puccinia graminis f. sp. tritici]|uniref:Sas10 C-terminal domain-containing protein n=1 Tax=Puccinia graminis f. sp. tritici TaxID=56615 RepID=A0A5B0S5R2_PUCGR|nr:hypothetical protein PGTUg99_005375 [Puccinia graminis f. sp. tritici]